MSTSYVEYDSNNSGGDWWLTDDDWRALEKAGWKVAWATLEHAYTEGGKDYVRDDDGTPKLVPLGTRKDILSFASLTKDGRRLGALATKAWKPGATSLREAAVEWERITGKSSTDAGCACCGQPHNFTLYRDGKYAERGPETSYIASWGDQ